MAAGLVGAEVATGVTAGLVGAGVATGLVGTGVATGVAAGVALGVVVATGAGAGAETGAGAKPLHSVSGMTACMVPVIACRQSGQGCMHSSYVDMSASHCRSNSYTCEQTDSVNAFIPGQLLTRMTHASAVHGQMERNDICRSRRLTWHAAKGHAVSKDLLPLQATKRFCHQLQHTMYSRSYARAGWYKMPVM